MSEHNSSTGRDQSTAAPDGAAPGKLVLHLFPDTNLFFQCLPLEQIPWSSCVECDEVHLIVCRPVQREIDNRTHSSNNRLRKRARRAHSTFRQVLVGNLDHVVVREKEPRVLLLIKPSYLPDQSLRNQLDYNQVDDSIVGCAFTYIARHPDRDTRLLTHDSGPMATARMLSLRYIPIPDEWLVSPERSEDDRKIAQLREELAMLKKTEPRFAIRINDAHGDGSDVFEFERNTYPPLTDAQVETLSKTLQTAFPQASDFGPRDATEAKSRDPLRHVLSGLRHFVPASAEDIEEYSKTAYPQWVRQCSDILRLLHVALQGSLGLINFGFSIINGGSRPGKDVLVTISARGNFFIRPPQVEENRQVTKNSMELPSPPEPPQGRWKDFFDVPTHSLGGPGTFPSLEAIKALGRHDDRRDPNEFYYKPDRAELPGESFSLECEQWRHGLDAETFEGEIIVPQNATHVHGAIECVVHAENLSIPIRKVVPVRATTKQLSTEIEARQLVEELYRRTRSEEPR